MVTEEKKSNKKKSKVRVKSRTVSPKNQAIYKQFLEWYCTPTPERDKLEQSISGFSKTHKIDRRNIYYWMEKESFKSDLEKQFAKQSYRRTHDIKSALYNEAVVGNVAAIKLYMQFFLKWTEKIEQKITHTGGEELINAIEKIVNIEKGEE